MVRYSYLSFLLSLTTPIAIVGASEKIGAVPLNTIGTIDTIQYLDQVDTLRAPFLEWVEVHGKEYDSEEEELERMLIWIKHNGTCDSFSCLILVFKRCRCVYCMLNFDCNIVRKRLHIFRMSLFTLIIRGVTWIISESNPCP